MASGAVLVAVLALLIDLILAIVQRYTVSRGITGRYSPASGSPTRPSSSRRSSPAA